MNQSGLRRLVAALALIAAATLISACGSSAPAQTSASEITTNHAKAVKFSECMRAHGVSAFPDPNASGQLTIDAVANGSSVNTNAPAFKQALSTCKHLEPPGFTGVKRTPERQQAALKFAECIREQGVKDFPDPAPNGPLVDTNRIPSAASASGIAILNAAMHRCSRMAAAAGVTR
jgi:hypothetical protein